ncbi:hypothetical protein [Zobellia sp. 1_MG-2023]|uniref:hypothetical protein n=1 Tax=Zobellia sp. 1_MG-2023 TaxID=3062626 RepID=UPI0026E361A1|nr:hypothetical protein [Zobellia sp. 1_MG-2023]MDO6820721.1 hypothetical protein [Zobellia sp. 1_MG-2023]
MQQEKDYLQREIQKLTLFLTKLISKISGSHFDDVENDLQQTDQEFQKNFGFSLFELMDLPNQKILDKLKDINQTHLEKITELLFESVKKAKETDKNLGIDIKTFSEKTIFLLEHLDNSSGTYSIDRMNKKNVLQQNL